jgi:tetratricopeptide (TPR) repeat protein
MTSLVDPGTRDATRDSPQKVEPPKPAANAPSRAPAAKGPSVVPQSNDRVAVAVAGAPSSDSARLAGIAVFKRAQVYFDRHDWDKAESSFHEALLLDGSQAPYHAGLGDVEMVLAKWEEAEAEFTAAMLLDVNNQEYRAKVLEARRRKRQP